MLNAAALVVHEDESTACLEGASERHSQLRDFLSDAFGSSRPQFNSIFSPQRRFKFGGRFGPNFYSQINDLLLDTVLRCMNPQHRYYLCFDELDFTFDPRNHDYYSRLVGLIRASMHINRKVKELGKNFSVIIFLRDDIYATINFEDKNKFNLLSIKMLVGLRAIIKHPLMIRKIH